LADFHPPPRRVSPIWAGRVPPDLDQKLLAPGEVRQQLLPMHLLQTPAQLHLRALLGTPAGIPQQIPGQAHLSEAGQPGLHHPRLWQEDLLSSRLGLLHKLHQQQLPYKLLLLSWHLLSQLLHLMPGLILRSLLRSQA